MTTENHKVQLEAGMDTSGVRVGTNEAKQAVKSMGDAVVQAGKDASKGIDGIGASAKGASDKVETAARSIANSIQRQTAAAQAGAKGTADFYEALAKQRGVSVEVLKPYLDQLREVKAAQKAATAAAKGTQTAAQGAAAAAGASLDGVGMSAKATAAALRGVPAQFTDIITSLQGGQRPLTVLLQQGGQLKDMFGGVGPAIRAVGGYVVSLVNPLTLAAGAVGALAYAFEAGRQEGEQFRRSVILTGGVAGVTADQLGSMAAAVSRLGSGTQGRAAEVLNQIAQSSAIGAANMQRFAAAAIDFERAGGPAAEETVKAFQALAKSPLEATLKLNEGTNFLTRSTYEQIRALEQQGRTTDAATVAQTAFFDAVQKRTPELRDNLGYIERGYRSILDVIKATADAALNVGRPKTDQDRMADLQKQIQAAQDYARATGGNLENETVKALQDELTLVSRRLLKQQEVLGMQYLTNEQLKAAAGWDQAGLQYMDKQAQLARAITQARNEGAAAGKTQAQIEERIAQIKLKYADQGGNSEIADIRAKITETQKYLDNLKKVDAFKADDLKRADLNDGEKLAIKLQQELAGALDGRTRASKQLALAEAKEYADLVRKRDLLIEQQQLVIKSREETAKQADAVSKQAEGISDAADKQEAANGVLNKSKAVIEAVTLAELKRQAADLQATDRTDPRYLAGLDAKIDAQERFVRALQEADRIAIQKAPDEWMRASQEQLKAAQDEYQFTGLTSIERAKIAASRQVELQLAKQISDIDHSSLSDADKEAARGKAQQAAAVANAAAQARIELDYLNKDYGSAMATGFDKASKSLAGLVQGVKQLADVQSLSHKSFAAEIDAYGNIAAAAKGFFKEGTSGYKAMENAERVFRAFEFAASVKNMAQKLLEVTTVTGAQTSGQALVAAGATASGATQVAAATAVGQANAVAAVANQGNGDPYTAFGRIPAMAVIMAALGFAVSGAFSSGPKADPGNTGTGTVLGDSTAQSKSIGNSIDRLASNSDIGLRYSAGMLSALNTIANSIGGLTSLVLRTAGLTDGSGFDVQTGTKVPLMNSAGLNLTLFGAATGGVLGATIGKLVSELPIVQKITSALFGTKTSVTGTGLYLGPQSLGSILDDGANLKNYADITKTKKFLGVTYSTSNSTQYQDADGQLTQQFSKLFASVDDALLAAAGPLGGSLDTIKNSLSSFVVNIGKINLKDLTGDQIQEKLTAVFGAAADNIASAVLPGLTDFQKVGEGYFDTVVRVASGVEQAQAALDNLGITAVGYQTIVQKQGDVEAELIRQSLLAFETAQHGVGTGVADIVASFSGSADDLVEVWRALETMRDGLAAVGKDVATLSADMIRGAGGAQQLQDGLQAYYDHFLTASEQIAAATQRLQGQFGAIGLALPSSSDAFKQLVLGIDTSTVSGQELFGKVISLAGAFGDLQDQIADAASGVGSLTDTLADLSSTRSDLENQILSLQGNDAAVAARTRAADLAKLTEGLGAGDAAQVTAAYDFNQALRDQITALQNAKTAADAAAQAEATRAKQQYDLETQLLQLQGDTDAIRQRELAALDPSNQALQERIYALQDEQAAQQAATQAAQELASQLQQLADTRFDLENQIIALQGDDATVAARTRERDLAKLTAGLNAADAAAVTAAYDYNAALQAQLTALQDAKEAADALKQAWQSTSDSIFDEVQKIRDLTAQSSPTSLAGAQAQFAISTAAARAGDEAAAKLLPGLAETLLTLAQSQASSQSQLASIRAQIAASLEATGQLLGATFGLNIPAFATGTNYVPRDMLALIHEGESIQPRAYNPAAGGIGGDATTAEEVRGLREDMRAQARAVVQLNTRLVKLAERWDTDGIPETRAL